MRLAVVEGGGRRHDGGYLRADCAGYLWESGILRKWGERLVGRMSFEDSLIVFDCHEIGARPHFPTRCEMAGNSSRCFLGVEPLPLYFLPASLIPN